MSSGESLLEGLARALLEELNSEDRGEVMMRVAREHPEEALSLLRAGYTAMRARATTPEQKLLADEAEDVLRRYAGESIVAG